jgi:hypothetical protein
MRKSLLISTVVVLSTVMLAAGAFAAAPKKGGVYQGTLFETSLTALPKKVRVVVDKTGTSARVVWWCGTGRAPNTLRIRLNAYGTFKGASNVGTLTVWGSRAGSSRRPRPGWRCSSRPHATPRAAPSTSSSSRRQVDRERRGT